MPLRLWCRNTSHGMYNKIQKMVGSFWLVTMRFLQAPSTQSKNPKHCCYATLHEAATTLKKNYFFINIMCKPPRAQMVMSHIMICPEWANNFRWFFSSSSFSAFKCLKKLLMSLILCRKFVFPYLSMATAAARAALLLPTRACSMFLCPNNGTASVWDF